MGPGCKVKEMEGGGREIRRARSLSDQRERGGWAFPLKPFQQKYRMGGGGRERKKWRERERERGERERKQT